MSYAVDVNLLLYASDADSPFSAGATAFLEDCVRREELLCVAWITLMGYLRMATHPLISRRPLAPEQAQRNVEALMGLPNVRVLSEEEGFWAIYRKVTRGLTARGNLVPDCHLAALLVQHGVRTLYTNDRGFRRFDDLRVINPFEASPG